MVGMPYLLLGILGCLVYRGRKHKVLLEKQGLPGAPVSPAPASPPA
jgi:hypothetical protein